MVYRLGEHSYGGNCVSDFLFRSSFLFYLKKRVTFGHFLKLNFLGFIENKKLNLGPK